ncbi:2TM domain-containing protein [Gloeocapsopsis crepidinum LEGE 06123]|uniref:2TM domain-containing protein n=1 Tax=Gloeocapsopsis crepidinum LEGE 06123 TaxID=588587 RepID=A0ABR9URF4_9CHRO|nr:2TM domain-containing protein [Gloeocapsopsis crepidinum]MBE9190851.1 2TM domain-containing protein [Gloeocapsopsis crepidinum LEGE 06123]
MPPRWPRKPDRRDPAYRRLDDRMNFAMHVAVFAVTNSGLWFFYNLNSITWTWLPLLTASWLLVLLVHLIYISAIADYSEPQTPPKST